MGTPVASTLGVVCQAFNSTEEHVDDLRPGTGRRFYAGLLEALIQVMGTAKGYLFNHGPRVALAARRVAESLELTEEERSEVFLAGLLMDLGMIGLVEDAWENPVPVLPEDSRARVVEHPTRSETSVRSIPHLERIAPLIRHHHEWWDGSGYPDGLRAHDIPVGARILRIADTVVALSSPRPQRAPLTPEEIVIEIREGAGVEFGPAEAVAILQLLGAGGVQEYHPSLFHRATLDAVGHLIPNEVSPLSTIEFLDIVSSLIDAKDPYTAGHSRRVGRLAAAMAKQLGLDEATRNNTWAAGYLHDLGKVGVPLSVLAKNGKLTADERRVVQSHAPNGAEILASIPALSHLSPGARYHHERWDGGGYPEGLSGQRIPIVGRILAVCDAYDAMTSQRAYRRSKSHSEALVELDRDSGAHFCPEIAQAFLGLEPEVFDDLWQSEKTLRNWLFKPIGEWRTSRLPSR
jgi:HD-GYP domain-containing protein (c-di-GMP phosphodiesterase class II)